MFGPISNRKSFAFISFVPLAEAISTLEPWSPAPGSTVFTARMLEMDTLASCNFFSMVDLLISLLQEECLELLQ
ncbi:MAG: hypothetical protein BROFUL_01058 [Candidatus Brocadia fulgida]|uniref:Uncharacterized protein n=1 Tax=Candidatus Brocadia fulgida TaxID=380242 RepID=A0A0M2UVW9_9BACT|nr:MAG: hypothetical protein BROFUL_01058 [Candidatus Brocadia fulgida]